MGANSAGGGEGVVIHGDTTTGTATRAHLVATERGDAERLRDLLLLLLHQLERLLVEPVAQRVARAEEELVDSAALRLEPYDLRITRGLRCDGMAPQGDRAEVAPPAPSRRARRRRR